MPDIHWHVGEGTERETISKSTKPRRSRRWLVVLLAVIFGVSLGALYRSIPEPAPHPTPTSTLPPTPSRQAIPAKLFETIDREAQALADGDFDAYRETQASSTQDRIEVQRETFTAWGRPGDGRSLYVIIDFDLLTDTSAWADIRQFRQGRYFRQTRFYYHYRGNDRWLHGPPNPSVWSGQEESMQTLHFDVSYAVEDRNMISPMLRQLEEDYHALCRDLGCASLGHELTFTLRIKPNERSYVFPATVEGDQLRSPSPHVVGFFESGRTYEWKNNSLHWVLALEIGKRVHGLRFDGTTDYEQPGSGLLWAGIFWAVDRIDPLPAKWQDALSTLQQKPLLSLETLWEIGGIDEPGLALAQLYHLVRFIEQEYGASAVTQLLEAIDSAQSLVAAIETGLGVPFAELDQKWLAWAKQNLPGQ